nr:cytochrome p450 3a11 [Quercus suber]
MTLVIPVSLCITLAFLLFHGPFVRRARRAMCLLTRNPRKTALTNAGVLIVGSTLAYTHHDKLANIFLSIGAILATSLVVAAFTQASKPPKAENCRATATSAKFQLIIEGKIDPETNKPNIITPHASRALPNKRLHVAFGIESCFTSDDPRFCKDFRARVEQLLSTNEDDWKGYANAARSVLSAALTSEITAVNLAKLVQMMTMKTMMLVLFRRDVNDIHDDDAVHALARGVNDQWLRSKGAFDDDPFWALHKQTDLMDAVRKVFPDWNGDGLDNPFNHILPGYETMWRVVLRCFLEIAVRQHTKAGLWRTEMQNFFQDPKLTRLDSTSTVSARYLALETLRLYPPTKRIYRRFQDDNGNISERAADVEALHRDPAHWGSNAKLFKPDRWTDHPEGTDDPNFMAFGDRPFRCPAKQWRNKAMPFALSMISPTGGSSCC